MSNKLVIGGGRIISLDLLRIIAMCMVLVLHTNLSGGFLKIEEPNIYRLLICLYEHMSIVAVDVFVIISAWFLSEKYTSFSKIVSLIWTILFWTIIMSIIAYMLGEQISFKDIAKSVPLIGRAYDFCSGYIVMYLCSPYLNKILDNTTKKQLSLLALGAFVLFSVATPLTTSHYLYIGGGYSFMWFVILYIITVWVKTIRDYFSIRHCLYVYLTLSFFCALADFYGIAFIGGLEYNNPFVAVSAFSIFLVFLKINIRCAFLARLVSFFAPLAFGVFLIHANFLFARWYQKFQFCNWISGDISSYLFGVPIFVAIVFICCSYLEYLRIQIFKLIKEKERTEKLCNKLDSIYTKLIRKLGN